MTFLDAFDTLLAPWRAVPRMQAAIAVLQTRMTLLEDLMSLTKDALADLDAATTAVADRVDALVAGNDKLDAETAEQIKAETAKLRGLAADPENPVPADPGTDAPTGDTGTDVPAGGDSTGDATV